MSARLQIDTPLRRPPATGRATDRRYHRNQPPSGAPKCPLQWTPKLPHVHLTGRAHKPSSPIPAVRTACSPRSGFPPPPQPSHPLATHPQAELDWEAVALVVAQLGVLAVVAVPSSPPWRWVATTTLVGGVPSSPPWGLGVWCLYCRRRARGGRRSRRRRSTTRGVVTSQSSPRWTSARSPRSTTRGGRRPDTRLCTRSRPAPSSVCSGCARWAAAIARPRSRVLGVAQELQGYGWARRTGHGPGTILAPMCFNMRENHV
jgi:hypothetical protein